MPSPSTLKRTIRKQRQKHQNPYVLPKAREDIIIPEEFKVAGSDDSPFLAYDSGSGDHDRILVFGTAKNFERLSAAKCWFMDGTFKVTPSLFYQIYTVHGLYHGAVIPFMYALLPNKKEETYQRLFSVLAGMVSNVACEVMYSDFEAAAITACARHFPQTRMQGCFFHLCQSVYRKLCKFGMQARYSNDEEFAVQEEAVLHDLLSAEEGPRTEAPSGVRRALHLRVQADTVHGETVFVCGSSPQLGDWQVSHALEMHLEDPAMKVWGVQVCVPVHQTLEFRYLVGILLENGHIIVRRWETVMHPRSLTANELTIGRDSAIDMFGNYGAHPLTAPLF
ncbi:hypothetical protein HPB48_002452 [Haemaphysalis longicornis]|uniref:CBM20 domain-containing protein n=1 Tax=Haemaphysalis longicornis TaxID=44386 RepID=A0A9J6FA89_HAELO|nr:hypothetical protein HPB48_002452 [Haemaphysalis longicornis]